MSVTIPSFRDVLFHGLRVLKYAVPAYLDQAKFPEGTIVVAGSGRSGTTWVGDTIAKTVRGRIVFEPFFVDKDQNLALTHHRIFRGRIDRNYPLYIPMDGSCSESYHSQIETILRGKIYTFWSEMESRPGIHQHRIIKEVRANLYLGVLAESWPSLKILLILRSPYSVIASQLRKVSRGWDFDWHKDDVLSQKRLMAEWLEPYRATIENAETHVERLTNRWCIETLVAIQQLANRPNALIVSYEHLSRTVSHWDDIRRFLSLSPWNEEAFETSVARPSYTSSRPVLDIQACRENLCVLDEVQMKTISQIVDDYGLMPLTQQLCAGEALVHPIK